MSKRKLFLGINLEMDPSVAIVEDGKVLVFSEEERHARIKHAKDMYPARALRSSLRIAGCELSDISALAINWNLTAYNDGTLQAFYQGVRKDFEVDPATVAWQDRNLKKRSWSQYTRMHEQELRRI